ncbi:LysR family transcriptional regulator [Tistrella bauzanensis]|mgnify:CR=1 FL=1|jgi:DNA-binding transcriptional LysR family regulator|uniref:LysR family transcriptional regulator n=1 Tax=Tistrella arctica TaxID=3133430 RepID=A0ABU9YK37_9PROT
MKRPNLAELEVFAAVADARSFRKAAAERGVSASALSQSIRNLEERLGVRLLNRTTRSVAPTDAGEQLLRRLRVALRDVAEAVDDIEGFRHRPAGTIRINAPNPAIDFVLQPLAKAFLDACPDVALELISDAAKVDIVDGGFDAGVRFGEELARDMIAIPLGPPLRYVVVGAPSYLRVNGTPATPDDLTGHNCIRQRFPGGTLFHWRFEKAGRAVAIAPEGRLTVSSAHHVMRAAQDGIGLGWVLDGYARPFLEAGTVVQVLDDWSPRIPEWYLYYPSRRQMPLAMRAFLDFIASRRSSLHVPAAPPPAR